MIDKISIRRKILEMLVTAKEKAEAIAAKLGGMLMDVIKMKGNMEGRALELKEHLAKIIKDNEDVQKFIEKTKIKVRDASGKMVDKELSAVIKERGNYDPATIYATMKALEQKLGEMFLETGEEEATIGRLEMKKVKITDTNEEQIAQLKEQIESMEAEAKELKDKMARLEKSGKDAVSIIAKSNVQKLYAEFKDRAKSAAETERTQKDVKKEVEQKPGKTPAPGVAPAPGSKQPERPKGYGKPAASLSVSAAKDLEDMVAELQQAESEVMESLSPFVEELSQTSSGLQSMMTSAQELESKMESMSEAPAEDSAPAEEPAEDSSEEEPGFLDKMLSPFMPSQEPAMAPMPAAAQDPWIKESDRKEYPSEHDMTGGLWELVEGEGQHHLVINKDLRSRVTKKLRDMNRGAYQEGQTVGVDYGDRLGEGVIKSYAGNNMYDVQVGAEVVRCNVARIFSIREDLWRD